MSNKQRRSSKLKDMFIESYNEVKNLLDKEKEMMPYLLKDEFIRKNLFVLNGVYKQNNRVWASNLSKFLIAMDEIKFFGQVDIYIIQFYGQTSISE